MGMPEVFEVTIVCGAAGRVDAREQRLLDVEALDHGLDDPVGAAGGVEVGVEAAGADGLRRGRG